VYTLNPHAKEVIRMDPVNHHRKVSHSPTNPKKTRTEKIFDVADLLEGPFSEAPASVAQETALDEKLRQAYFWITNHAIISPFYDIEYQDGPTVLLGEGDTLVVKAGEVHRSGAPAGALVASAG